MWNNRKLIGTLAEAYAAEVINCSRRRWSAAIIIRTLSGPEKTSNV